MLFNSYEFLFLFLPVTVGVFFLLGRMQQQRVAIAWLVLASLFFYGYWNPIYLLLIIASMIGNYWLGRWTSARELAPIFSPKFWLVIGIAANLSALAYFKYANFFISNVNLMMDEPLTLEKIVLPLAISFFTFQQIAFLVDSYRGEAKEYSFLHYALFVTFFPQLIAGPIVHHKEMLPQFASREIFCPSVRNMAIGITWLIIGLFKKVEIADTLALYATPIFSAADQGSAIWLLEAWGAALAYTFQLYFDFSGYVDMAMGSAMMIGVRLPTNFNSPYKSLNIIDFWRRWHMTLSRFLRDYLYIALGGNRHGQLRRYINLSTTMVLGGLWHGASWTFVFWGALHGFYLIVNHAWNWIRGKLGMQPGSFGYVGRVSAWLLTFLAVVVAWVFFRAETFSGALNILAGMFAINVTNLPETFADYAWLQAFVVEAGWDYSGALNIRLQEWAGALALIAVCFPIVLLLPNTNEIFRETQPGETGGWQPNSRWAALASLMLIISILDLGQVSEFLYFNF